MKSQTTGDGIQAGPLPESVTLVEVGPRDGFQLEKRRIPTALKLEIIHRLAESGLKEIQVTAFVHPERVPQMADAEAVVNGLAADPNVRYTGLVLNSKGLDRAIRAGMKHIEISISASDTHSRKNTGMNRSRALQTCIGMIRKAKAKGAHVRAGIQCAFGCVYEGPIPTGRILDLTKSFLSMDVDMLSLADTTGMGHPLAIREIAGAVSSMAGRTPVALHLHDTRGLGLVNMLSGIAAGITIFDTAFGGMGGCPFVPGAAGNITTEDAAYLMSTLGISTGVDIERVAACSKTMEAFLGKRFPGKWHHLTGKPGFPAGHHIHR